MSFKQKLNFDSIYTKPILGFKNVKKFHFGNFDILLPPSKHGQQTVGKECKTKKQKKSIDSVFKKLELSSLEEKRLTKNLLFLIKN